MNRIHPLIIAVALSVLVPATFPAATRQRSYDELASASDRIVLGTIGAKSSYYGSGSRIYSDVVVYPDVTVKGAEQAAFTVTTLGGTVGDVRMSVSDGPEFTQGERILLFLRTDAGHLVVTDQAGGSVALSSAAAATALERAFAHVERRTGVRQTSKRSLAASYLNRVRGALTNGLTSSAQAMQVGCYSTDGARWATSSATYRVMDSIPAEWAPGIDASASTWSNAGAAFRLVNDSGSNNELSVADLVGKYGSSYSNTLAVTTTWSSVATGRISRATIEINNKWLWSTTGDPNSVDVQNIVTHEFGHWTRLLDIYSPAECSYVTMWGSAGFGETSKRSLEQPDLDGLVSLYGISVAPPGAPVLSSPANGTANVPTSATLTWNAVASAASYDVYLGTEPSPAFAGTVSGTSFSASLIPGATYYWRVAANNSQGSASSGTFSFTVASPPPAAPQGPTLLSPVDGADGVSVSPLMEWTAVPGAVSYDVYIGTTPDPPRLGSTSGTSGLVGGFSSGTVYYWKIVARTPTESLSSPVASFRTE